MIRMPSNEEKKAVWTAYHARKPDRVPLMWSANPRSVLLDPKLNPEKYDFRQYFQDPHVALVVQSRFQEYAATRLNRTCDTATGLPEYWSFYLDGQNVFDAAYFGAPVQFPSGGQPSVQPVYTMDEADKFLRMDYSNPLQNNWIKDRIRFHTDLVKEAEHFEYLGRKGRVQAFVPGFDGPLTALVSLFGEDGLVLMSAEPEKAGNVLLKITRDCIRRTQALGNLAGEWKPSEVAWFADDAIQMISVSMLRDIVLPSHALWYDTMGIARASDKKRFIHLCGDATRHFVALRDILGVYSFDTGFPVDHGRLRRELGPDVEIMGGPHVGLLMTGSVRDCADVARNILESGIMQGGLFILKEGNNLPPCVPIANLQAVYEACLEYGRYE